MRLSISQPTLYRDCPHAYKCRYIDKIEVPQAEALEFGTNFHKAISEGTEDSLISKMVSAVKNSEPFNWEDDYEYEKKEYVNLEGFNFTYIVDATNIIKIFEFKSASKPWVNNRFQEEWQPHIYIKGEEINTGEVKEFYYIVVTKEDNPKVQVERVEFNQDIYNKIIETAGKLKNDFEFKPTPNKNCYFCDYKSWCPNQF